MYLIKFFFRFSDKYKERQDIFMDIGKTEFALAQASSYRNLNSAIISSYSTPAYSTEFSGLNAQLLYKIYDSMAITPSVLKSYYEKMTDAGTGTTPETKAVEASAPYQTQLGDNRGYDYDRVRKLSEEMKVFYDKPENSGKTFIPAASPGLDVTA